MFKLPTATRRQWTFFGVITALYLLFLLWVGSWWGLLVLPFIFDLYITRKINWGWWRDSPDPIVRTVMSWVDAIVFALVAIYFINQYFFQNFVIPSSSLEKTLLTGDYLLVSKLSYGPRIPQTPSPCPSRSTICLLGWEVEKATSSGHNGNTAELQVLDTCNPAILLCSTILRATP